MLTNCEAITIYNLKADKTYERIVIRDVFWSDSKSALLKKGIENTFDVLVDIPKGSVDGVLEVTTGKSYLVKGECDVVIDNTSSTAIANSLKLLTNYYLITSFADKTYGSQALQHYKITGNRK